MPVKHLPIWTVMDTVLASVRMKRNVVLTAETGSGKSTQVPQALCDSGIVAKGVILVVEPRRIACRATAQRVAWERGSSDVEIGYIVRYERRAEAGTKICFVTDGVLIRLLERDRHLDGVSAVIFDEFHERRMLSDLALGLVKDAQRHRNDLRIMAMSATLDAESVATYLDADVVSAPGKMYPVSVTYVTQRPSEAELSAAVVEHVWNLVAEKTQGDILVFLPGKREIVAAERALNRGSYPERLEVLPLYGELHRDAQQKIFEPCPYRKVVLATNIAETSLTIPGMRNVIDSGLERRAYYNHRQGITSLSLVKISQASAQQRTGRAGREAPGCCIRLWAEDEHAHLDAITPPEIRRSDVASIVLTLKSVGVQDVRAFDFFEAPPAQQIDGAERLLKTLTALDDAGDLTKTGWNMLRLPLPPRFARMMVEAERSGCLKEVATIVVLLSGRPVFVRPPGQAKQARDRQRSFAVDMRSDFLGYLEVYHQWRVHRNEPGWCERNFLSREVLEEAARLRYQIVGTAFRRGSRWNHWRANTDAVLRSIAAGLIDRAAKRIDGDRYLLANGVIAEVDDVSVVREEMLIAGDIRTVIGRKGETQTLFSLASVLTPERLEQLGFHRFELIHSLIEYSPSTGVARVRDELRFIRMPFEVKERLSDWKEAWQLSSALRKQAKAEGDVEVRVEAGPRNTFRALVGRHRIPVAVDSAGTYFATIKGTEDRPKVLLRGKLVEVPPPAAKKSENSLESRLARLGPIVERLNRKDP